MRLRIAVVLVVLLFAYLVRAPITNAHEPLAGTAHEPYTYSRLTYPGPGTNMANAGRTIPLKFSLAGYHGLDILLKDDSGAVAFGSTRVDCDNPLNVDLSSAALQTPQVSYDASPDQYIVEWDTDRSWEGSCRRVAFWLNDGMTVDGVTFQFGTPVSDPQAPFSDPDAASLALQEALASYPLITLPMQGLVEYALIFVLVAVVVIAVLTVIVPQLQSTVNTVCARLPCPRPPPI